MNRYLFTAAVGAAAMYFLDPELGPRRRDQAQRTLDDVLRRLRKARRTVDHGVEKLSGRRETA